MAALKKVNALLKSFDLFSALSINKKYVFIQLYMQIHWSLIVCYDILHNVVFIKFCRVLFSWIALFSQVQWKGALFKRCTCTYMINELLVLYVIKASRLLQGVGLGVWILTVIKPLQIQMIPIYIHVCMFKDCVY